MRIKRSLGAIGKPDEGDRVEKFLADHLRAAELRLQPIATSLATVGFELNARQLAESLVERASIRATGRDIERSQARDILQSI